MSRVIWLDSHSILARWRNLFSQLLNVRGVNDVMHTEIQTAEQLVPEPSAYEVELPIEKLRFAIPYRRFGTTYRSHLQGLRNLRIIPRSTGFLALWRWYRYVILKRRYGITTLHCLMSQKSADLIYIAADAWNYGVYVWCTFRYMSVWHCCARIWPIHFSNVCWHGVYMICEILLMLEVPYCNFDRFVVFVIQCRNR